MSCSVLPYHPQAETQRLPTCPVLAYFLCFIENFWYKRFNILYDLFRNNHLLSCVRILELKLGFPLLRHMAVVLGVGRGHLWLLKSQTIRMFFPKSSQENLALTVANLILKDEKYFKSIIYPQFLHVNIVNGLVRIFT